MAVAISRENYTLHKLHSLTGIIPVGYYLVQHLTLNTFSLAGPSKFNAILAFFNSMPAHFLFALKAIAIWIPLIFHAVYGIFIASRAKVNSSEEKYRFRENRYYTYQRATGILAFLFLCYHMTSTSVMSAVTGKHEMIEYASWAGKLSGPVLGIPYLILVVYLLGIAASAYHFSFGLWSFCIRWGITISEKAQNKIWRVATVMFPAITLIGYVALYGFFNPIFQGEEPVKSTPGEALSGQTTSYQGR